MPRFCLQLFQSSVPKSSLETALEFEPNFDLAHCKLIKYRARRTFRFCPIDLVLSAVYLYFSLHSSSVLLPQNLSFYILTDVTGFSAMHCGIVSPAMHRTDHNANGVIHGDLRRISSSRKFHESRKIEPTDIARMANRTVNGNVKHHEMLNGKVKKVSTTSLDPNSFFEAATLLGSVGSLKAAETTERVRRGSTSYEEDAYKGFPFPFENLVFEGGGNKGMAYVGALQVFFSIYAFILCCCVLLF